MQDIRGRFGRRINAVQFLRPDVVWLDTERRRLRFKTEPLVCEAVPPELLDGFMALDGASDEQICRFAQKYGVLAVEEFVSGSGEDHEEELEPWRYWIARVRAVISGAASLHNGEAIRAEDWNRLDPPAAKEWEAGFRLMRDLSSADRRAFTEQRCVADVLNEFLARARVRPCFTWFPPDGGISFTNLQGTVDEDSITLSGALALQVVLLCARAESIATCSGCRVPYFRQWHSPTGRRNYCKSCRDRGVAWRDSKRVLRAGRPGSQARKGKRQAK